MAAAQEQGTQEQRPRSVLDRYPGVLTDWGGRFIDKQILSYIAVGNIVRVAFKAVNSEQKNTAYIRIIKKCKKQKNWFLGVCEDPYYGEDPWFLLKNGDKRAFSIHHITEIPLEWQGNENLKKNATLYDKGRSVTGIV